MMKRRDLMKRLGRIAEERGERLEIIEGGSHTKVAIGDTQTVVPRHREINERTAKAIMKQAEGEK